MKSLRTRMIWLTIFSIAMGFLETAVVVYLRKIYYPAGFKFPLVPIDPNIGLIEFLREAATIIMLVGMGVIAGKNASQKFVIFIYCFAIWDIFYYVFLKLLLGWPMSLFTWDILFLIPVPWVGPVLAPCIVSLTMIMLTASVIYIQEKGYAVYIRAKEWVLLIAGSVVVIFSFMLDYIKYVFREGSAAHLWTLSGNQDVFNEIKQYVPTKYNWWVFSLGELIILTGIATFIIQAYKAKGKK